MRLLLDLRQITDHVERQRLAVQADTHGIWGVVVTGPPGAETVEASAIATATDHVTIAVDIDGEAAHPTTIAEEVAVLDQLSQRRTMVILRAGNETRNTVTTLLKGLPKEGVILSPPPAQAAVVVHGPEDIPRIEISQGPEQLAELIDQHRDANEQFLVVATDRSVKELARPAIGRAASTDFPQMVANMADQIDPIN